MQGGSCCTSSKKEMKEGGININPKDFYIINKF